MRENVIAIVPAAGLGKRLGSGTNKPFYSLLNKPLLAWTIEALEQVEEISEIIPVLKESDMEGAVRTFEQYSFSKVKRIAPGGSERQDSVYHGLKLADAKAGIILVHDGARPLITVGNVREVIAALDGFDGAVAGVPVKDTIKETATEALESAGKASRDRAEERKAYVVKRTVKREALWSIQTPQVFRCDVLVKAYEKAMEEGFYGTDDSGLVERIGGRVRMVMGSYDNIKITTPEDILVAEGLLRKRMNEGL
jgi:2-C-methyl-D-erythritol 4-phosphate cytidylyltransferase